MSLSFKKQIEEQTQVTFFRLKTKFKAPLKAASIGSIKILRNMTVKVYDKADQYQSEKNMLCKIILQLTHKAFPIQYRPQRQKVFDLKLCGIFAKIVLIITCRRSSRLLKDRMLFFPGNGKTEKPSPVVKGIDY